MAKRNIFRGLAAVLALGMCMTGLAGCGSEKRADGKTEIEVVSYKPEAVKAFEKIEKRFNETHDDIHLTISSPNEAMTIFKDTFYPGGLSGYHRNRRRHQLFQLFRCRSV